MGGPCRRQTGRSWAPPPTRPPEGRLPQARPGGKGVRAQYQGGWRERPLGAGGGGAVLGAVGRGLQRQRGRQGENEGLPRAAWGAGSREPEPHLHAVRLLGEHALSCCMGRKRLREGPPSAAPACVTSGPTGAGLPKSEAGVAARRPWGPRCLPQRGTLAAGGGLSVGRQAGAPGEVTGWAPGCVEGIPPHCMLAAGGAAAGCPQAGPVPTPGLHLPRPLAPPRRKDPATPPRPQPEAPLLWGLVLALPGSWSCHLCAHLPGLPGSQ